MKKLYIAGHRGMVGSALVRQAEILGGQGERPRGGRGPHRLRGGAGGAGDAGGVRVGQRGRHLRGVRRGPEAGARGPVRRAGVPGPPPGGDRGRVPVRGGRPAAGGRRC